MSDCTPPETIELFLFDFCPFAQRVQMSLIQSQLPYKATVLTPGQMPDDFSTISPLGNVPVLRVNNSDTVFESAVINDYIAQISPISIEPKDELQTAQMRAWSEYINTCFGALMGVLQATDEDSFQQANQALINKFQPLSAVLSSQNGGFFYGEQFTTIDSTYAPLFLRMHTLNQLFQPFSLEALPSNIKGWMDTLVNCEPLKKSIVGDFPTIYRSFIARMATDKYIDSQL
ncbi:MAG: glutathione S-transferase family protein [Gammaproteobacteria bacterium]|nr:glutathione S-transferase family protein [Gammaproteobacteria bacterium]